MTKLNKLWPLSLPEVGWDSNFQPSTHRLGSPGNQPPSIIYWGGGGGGGRGGPKATSLALKKTPLFFSIPRKSQRFLGAGFQEQWTKTKYASSYTSHYHSVPETKIWKLTGKIHKCFTWRRSESQAHRTDQDPHTKN